MLGMAEDGAADADSGFSGFSSFSDVDTVVLVVTAPVEAAGNVRKPKKELSFGFALSSIREISSWKPEEDATADDVGGTLRLLRRLFILGFPCSVLPAFHMLLEVSIGSDSSNG